jgi:uncharacterized membrane protein YheB (UPF0754 family)
MRMTKILAAMVDRLPFPMHVAHALLTKGLADHILSKIMPKKPVKQAAKKAAAKKTAKKAAKKTAKKAVKKATKKVAKKAAKKGSASAEVTSEQISQAAYLIYINRQQQGIDGSHTDDWLAAEAALKSKKR